MDDQGRALPMFAVSSMENFMERCSDYPAKRFQVYFDPSSSLSDSREMNKMMRPGVKGTGYATFNPEVLRLKVQAEAAAQAAIGRAERSVERAGRRALKTEAKIRDLEKLVNAGPDKVHVGPSINQRSLTHEQTLYRYDVAVPEQDVLVPRKLSRKRKLRSRGIDAASQMAFWEMNLDMLRQKLACEITHRDDLSACVKDLRTSLLHGTTLIGSGYADYTFRF